jgi:hypothetical protein
LPLGIPSPESGAGPGDSALVFAPDAHIQVRDTISIVERSITKLVFFISFTGSQLIIIYNKNLEEQYGTIVS